MFFSNTAPTAFFLLAFFLLLQSEMDDSSSSGGLSPCNTGIDDVFGGMDEGDNNCNDVDDELAASSSSSNAGTEEDDDDSMACINNDDCPFDYNMFSRDRENNGDEMSSEGGEHDVDEATQSPVHVPGDVESVASFGGDDNDDDDDDDAMDSLPPHDDRELEHSDDDLDDSDDASSSNTNDSDFPQPLSSEAESVDEEDQAWNELHQHHTDNGPMIGDYHMLPHNIGIERLNPRPSIMHPLAVMKIKYDIDSICLISKRITDILDVFESGGKVEIFSMLDRVRSYDRCRVAADFHGQPNLRPKTFGKNTHRLKVISLGKFPNMQLLKIVKDNQVFTGCIHLLRPEAMGDSNFFTSKYLYTIAACMNCAISGELELNADNDGDAKLLAKERVIGSEWRKQLPHFDVQTRTKSDIATIKNHSSSGDVGKLWTLLYRFQRVLELLATNRGDEIDRENQTRDDTPDKYWKLKQSTKESDTATLSLQALQATARILYPNMHWVVTAAGIKECYDIPDISMWNGPQQAVNIHRRNVRRRTSTTTTTVRSSAESQIESRYINFQRDQHLLAAKRMEQTLPGFSPQSRSVMLFYDFAMESTLAEPYKTSYQMLPMIKEGGALLKRVCGSATRHRKFQSLDVAYNATIWDRSVHDLSDDEDDAVADNDTLQSDIFDQPEVTEVDFLYDLLDIQSFGYCKNMNSMIGNTHTGSIRMNAVEPCGDNPSIWTMTGVVEPDDPPIEVILRNPTASNIVGGQVYIPHARVTEMAHTRKNRDSVCELLPRIIFLCRHGMDHGRPDQAAKNIDVYKHVEALQAVYKNWHVRNSNGKNLDATRVELFCLYNVDGQRMPVFPDVFPSSCVHFFDLAEMKKFMRDMMDEHVRPVLELLKKMRPVDGASGGNFDLTQLSAELRTRIVVSTDIALTIMGVRGTGAFSTKLFKHLDAGASLEIPNVARTVLSAQEIRMYHFKYGVIPGMIPLCWANVNAAPRYIGDVSVNLSGRNCFPPYLPVLGRAMVASSVGGIFASKLEEYTALVRVCILRFGFVPPEIEVEANVAEGEVEANVAEGEVEANVAEGEEVESEAEGEVEENVAEGEVQINVAEGEVAANVAEGDEEDNVAVTRFGIMDGPNYVVLANLSSQVRGQMITDIARLLLGCVCHDTWMWVANGRQASNVFPIPAAGDLDDDVAEQFDARGRLKFDHFPFTNTAILALRFPNHLTLISEISSAGT